MPNGILGAIANPEFADVVGAHQLGTQQRQQNILFDQQQQQLEQQARVRELSGQILGMTQGAQLAQGGYEELARLDPQAAFTIAQGLGIPADQPGRVNNLVGTALMAETIANSVGPQEALSFVERERAKLHAFGIQTPIMDQFITQLQTDPVNAMGELSEFVAASREAGLLKAAPGVSAKEQAEIAKLQAETEKIRSETLGRTKNQKTKLELERLNLDIDLKNQQLEAAKLEATEKAQAKDQKAILQAFDASNGLDIVNTLLDGEAFEAIYGFGDGIIPTILPGSVALEAQRDQLIGLLSLESREKLKGQGTISDSESKMLGDAATSLRNPNISEKAAKRELTRIKDLFERKVLTATDNPAARSALEEAGKIQVGPTAPTTAPQSTTEPQQSGTFSTQSGRSFFVK